MTLVITEAPRVCSVHSPGANAENNPGANAWHPMQSTKENIFGPLSILSKKHADTCEGKRESVCDAKQVAWAMTCVPYMEDPEIDMDLFAASVKIQKEMKAKNASKRSLYEELIARGDNDVRMEELEAEFGFRWAIDSSCPQHDDPYYVRLINAEVEASLSSFLVTLDLVCTSLAGLEANQTSNTTTEWVMKARSFAAHRLGRVMTSATGTREELLQEALEIEDRYEKLAVAAYKRDVESAVYGVNSLTYIAASVQTGGNVSSVLQLHYSAARDTCIAPPRHLVEALASAGLSLSVLSACFAQIGSVGTTGASSLPPSWGRAVDMITEYFSSPVIAERFSHACVAAIVTMRSDLAHGDSSCAWSGICVATTGDARVLTARTYNRTDLVYELRACSHNSTPTGLAACVVDCTPRALRVVRFVRALTECVRQGVLRPRVVKANVLLASVARFRSERRFQLGRIVENSVRPLSLRASAPLDDGWFNVESVVTSVLASPREPRGPQFSSATSASPFVPACKVVEKGATDASGVLLALERDFHIVCSFQRVIPRSGGEIPLKTISGLLTASGAYFEGHSKRSVEQSVAFVVDKCVKRVQPMLTDGEVTYKRATPGTPGGGSVDMDFSGAQTTAAFLHNTISKMRSADKAFMAEWHVSRSSRNKAKSRAAERVTDAVGETAPPAATQASGSGS